MTIDLESLEPAVLPRSIVRAIWKHKRLVALVTLAGALLTIAVVVSLQPVYLAEALILVEGQKIPENFVAPTVQTPLEDRLDRLKQQVLSNERLWQLIEDLNLYPKQRTTRTRDEVLGYMRNDITIKLERNWSANRPGAFRVSYEAPDPRRAAEVANRIGNFFINENLTERSQEASGTSKFLDGELEDARRKLQEQEAKLREFKDAYNGELPEQEGSLLAQMSQDKAELLGVQDAIGRAQQNKLMYESALAISQDSMKNLRAVPRRSVDGGRSSFAAAPETELDKARAELREAQLRYKDGHPEIKRLKADIARLEQDPSQSPAPASSGRSASSIADPDASSDPMRDSLLSSERLKADSTRAQITMAEQEIRSLDQRSRKLIQESAEIQTRIQKIPIREEELTTITRDYETCKANYHSLLDKKLAADVATNMERGEKAERFVMLDLARPPEKPVRPKRAMLTAGGTLFWLALAMSLAFVRELQQNTFLGEWELPAGTVVLGNVPELELSKHARTLAKAS